MFVSILVVFFKPIYMCFSKTSVVHYVVYMYFWWLLCCEDSLFQNESLNLNIQYITYMYVKSSFWCCADMSRFVHRMLLHNNSSHCTIRCLFTLNNFWTSVKEKYQLHVHKTFQQLGSNIAWTIEKTECDFLTFISQHQTVCFLLECGQRAFSPAKPTSVRPVQSDARGET